MKYAATLSGVVTLRMMGLFLILPVFMLLARKVSGYTPQTAGMAVGIYGLTQALLQQPFGWLSDRWGRKPVMLLGLGLFAAGSVIAALADSMGVLIAGRALQGCGAIAGVAMAFAADLTRPERRPVVMAILGIGIGAAFLLSMMLSVPLATLLGLNGLFWLTALAALLGMALVLTLPAGRAPTHQPAEGEPGGNAPISLPVVLLSVSVFLLHMVMTLLFVALPPMLAGHFALALPQHWKIYVPTMLLSAVLMFPLLRRTGASHTEHRVISWAFLMLALALMTLPLSPGLLALAALVTAYFLAFNLLEASMPALLSRIVGAGGRGRRLGFYSTFQFLGAFVGGAAGGWLLAHFGSGVALSSAGAVCLLWGGVIFLQTKRFFPAGAGS